MTSKDSYRKYHDRIIVYNHLLSSTKRYVSLDSYSFVLYQNLVFYYLGMLQCEDINNFDQELQSAIYDLEKYSFHYTKKSVFHRNPYLPNDNTGFLPVLSSLTFAKSGLLWAKSSHDKRDTKFLDHFTYFHNSLYSQSQ